MSIRISLLVRLESSVLQQCSMVLGTCDHLFSVSLPSKKLWYLLVSIAGSLIHLVDEEKKQKRVRKVGKKKLDKRHWFNCDI